MLILYKKLLTFSTFTNLSFILLTSQYSILPLIPKLLAMVPVLFEQASVCRIRNLTI